MSDLPPDGNEPRNSKRPANVVRVAADELDEAPPTKRSKVTSNDVLASKNHETSESHVFHSRIFLSIVSEAFSGGRFTVLEKAAVPELGAQTMLCVSIDMNIKPNVITIKKKIEQEHGYAISSQVLWTPDDGVLADPSICPDSFVKSGFVLYLTLLPSESSGKCK